MTRHAFEVLVFDDLVLGDEWESPARTVTETDVVLFAGLSGDFNPLHSNHELSKNGPFGRPVAHGILGLAIATGLITHAPRIDTLAFLAILEWRFHAADRLRRHHQGGFACREPASPGKRPPRHRHLASSSLESGFNHRSRRPHSDARSGPAPLSNGQTRPLTSRNLKNLNTIHSPRQRCLSTSYTCSPQIINAFLWVDKPFFDCLGPSSTTPASPIAGIRSFSGSDTRDFATRRVPLADLRAT